MTPLSTAKWFNVLGCAFQLAGLGLLARVDLAGVRAAEAEGNIRDGFLLEAFHEGLKGRMPESSTQQIEAEKLAEKAATSSARYFRIGLLLVTIGTASQLIGACLGE